MAMIMFCYLLFWGPRENTPQKDAYNAVYRPLKSNSQSRVEKNEEKKKKVIPLNKLHKDT